MGFRDGRRFDREGYAATGRMSIPIRDLGPSVDDTNPFRPRSKPKRKLSAWNKFVKANSKKKIYRYANGKLKLKKMGIAFRKKKRR